MKFETKKDWKPNRDQEAKCINFLQRKRIGTINTLPFRVALPDK